MAYEVTATRRRPRRFEDVIGQEFVVATLQKSISAGKIAHAYLFSGPRGCGKTTSARILARALNCESGPTATPCGTCPACVEIARGSSLDVIEIDGASNTSVNDVRQIKDEVQFPPNSCRYKVYIIDEVHMLSTSAFNALLKTIEEPPPYVVFIFATTELHKVPATIKSRCQQFNVRLVPVELLKGVLADAAAESGIKADEEALFWIAREATGSVRDAYTLFDQVAAFSDGHITFEKIRDKLGLLGVDRINPLVDACVERRAMDALDALDAILQGGASIEQITVDLADYFRSLLLIKSGIRKESLLGQNPDRFSSLAIGSWSAVQIERALGVMLQLFRDIRYSLDPRYELELAVSRLTWISDYVSSADMKAAIVQARSLLLKGSSAAPSAPGQGTAQVSAMPAGNAPGASTSGTATAERQPDEQRGASGPFSEADRFPEDDGAVREEERIEDPFAALKRRLASGGGSPAATPVAATSLAPAFAESHEGSPRDTGAPEPESAGPETPDASVREYAEEVRAQVALDDLPAALVACFQSTKNMVATGLSQATGWKEEGGTIHFSVESSFTRNLLEQERKIITAEVCRLLGRTVGIDVHLESSRQAGSGPGEGGVPPEVEMVRHLFRGTVVGGA